MPYGKTEPRESGVSQQWPLTIKVNNKWFVDGAHLKQPVIKSTFTVGVLKMDF